MENQQITVGGKNAADASLLHAEYIENTYEKLTHLGGGNKSDVVLVKEKGSGRIAVRKKISSEGASLYQEVKRLHHPNIVRIYEVCNHGEDSVIVEEFISGETLWQKLKSGLLTQEQAIKYCIQILDALEQLHGKGIIHRDITPANVLISSDDTAKLIDFGISRYRKQNRTQDTEILGTVGYAAPEQFGFRQTDVGTDFYALGVMLNVMLTGKLPGELLTANRRLRRIVEKCIQMDPDKRYKSAGKMRQDLQRLLTFRRQNEYREDASVIPGFRSNILWRKVIATVSYAAMLIYTIMDIIMVSSSAHALLLEGCSLLSFWMVYFVGSNFGRWDEWLFPFSRFPKGIVVIIRIVACFVLFMYGAEISNYVMKVVLSPAANG